MTAHTIQLALAPVFVLVAIGNIMNILTNRLARVVDRSRSLREHYNDTSGDAHDQIVVEMRVVARRISLIGQALRLLVLSSLAIGLTVVVLFSEEIVQVKMPLIAEGAFVVAIGLLMAALTLFLRETQVASNALRIPESYLELDRKL